MRFRSGAARTLLTGLISVGLLLATSSAAVGDGHDLGEPRQEPVLPTALGTAHGWTEHLQEKNDWTWSGADQATSVQASNGAVYWLYGDTVLGTENPITGGYDEHVRMIANTIFVQRDGVMVPATAPGQPAIPDVPNPSADLVPGNLDDNDRYWPGGRGRARRLPERVRPAGPPDARSGARFPTRRRGRRPVPVQRRQPRLRGDGADAQLGRRPGRRGRSGRARRWRPAATRTCTATSTPTCRSTRRAPTWPGCRRSRSRT